MFLLKFWNLHKILDILKRKISFIAYLFWKLWTLKNVINWMPQRSSFRTPLGSQSVNESQILLKPASQNFYPNFLLIWGKLSLKTFLLVRCKILGLFFDTLTAYHMYSRQNWEKFSQQVQMELSPKPLKFFDIFIAFWNMHKTLHILKKRITFIA